jgi:predicted AAA+ superfamily ATPase
MNQISQELKCVLLIGPRASGKTTTVLDLENEFDDILMI